MQGARRFRYAAYRCGKRQREEERREEVMWCMMIMMETASSLILESLEMTSSLLGRCLWARAWEHCVRRAKANRCQRETTTPSGRDRNQSTEMTYVFAMTRIQAGGVQTLHRVVCLCCARFPSALFGSSASSPKPSSRDAKAAFVTAAIPA